MILLLLAPLAPLAPGAVIGGGLDLAVQGVQMWKGQIDSIDWGSVGISAAGGALSGGLGSFATTATRSIARQTIGIGARAFINGSGSAAIGAYTQVVRNAVNGDCLGNGVRSAAFWNGVFGTGASVFGDGFARTPTTTLTIRQNRVNYYRGREVPRVYTERSTDPLRVAREVNRYSVSNAFSNYGSHFASNATNTQPLFENE